MLEQLRIRGLGVIEDAELPLGPGFTVVTGETGAGKTMVVTGLALLFGSRADPARVRAGAGQASVEGRVELAAAPSQVAERVRAAGGELDDGTGLVLRRVVTAAGRSRAHAGGAAVPVAVLAELAEALLAVHGQADQLLLTRPSAQRDALDRYGGVDTTRYRACYERWRTAEGILRERLATADELRREAELLGHGLAEIEAADPQPGEDAELSALSARLAHGEALRAAARNAHDALLGDADAPLADTPNAAGLLAAAAREVGRASGADPQLAAHARALADVQARLADLGAELGSYAAGLEADPARLEQVEQRRAVLAALNRRYRQPGEADGVDAVLAWAGQAARRLTQIDVSDETLAGLSAERAAAAQAAGELAGKLSAARTGAGARLAAAVTAELAGLAMPDAGLQVTVRPRPAGSAAAVLEVDGVRCAAGPDGVDEVEFALQPHPDAPALPLARGASGGELSRVMLALEVCLAASDPVPTMVFDEVDAGVGGRAAIEVGSRLARLAAGRQVLVVTHLAQVAAYADRHVVVATPRDPDGRVLASDVRVVTGAERIGELARMLGGTDSAAARAHAGELLQAAAAAQGEPGTPAAPRSSSGPRPASTRASGRKGGR